MSPTTRLFAAIVATLLLATAGTASAQDSAPTLDREAEWELGQARGLGASGFVFGGSVAALAVGTMVANSVAWYTADRVTPNVLGGATLITAAVGSPVAAAGGARARRIARRYDLEVLNPGLRVLGWVSYGFSMGTGAAMLGLGIGGLTVPNNLILAPVALSLTSLVAFGVDALLATAHVNLQVASRGIDWREERLAVRPRATVNFWASPSVDGGASVGLSGTF